MKQIIYGDMKTEISKNEQGETLVTFYKKTPCGGFWVEEIDTSFWIN